MNNSETFSAALSDEFLRIGLDPQAVAMLIACGESIDELNRSKQILSQEREELLRQNEVLRNRISDLESSTTWRVTKPLRSLSALFSKRPFS